MSDLDIQDVPSIDLEIEPINELDLEFSDIQVVEGMYQGKETDNIILTVDESDRSISATLKQVQFDSRAEFPEIGSPKLVYVDLSDNSLWIYRDNGYVAISSEQGDTTGQVIFLGIDGIIEADRVVFEVQNAESFIDYRTNQREFLVTGNLPVVGQLDDTLPVAITFGDTTYNVYSFLKGGDTPLTVGDLKSVMSYNINTGFYLYSRMVFIETSDIVGFVIMPATITARQLDNILDDTDTIVKMTDGTKLSLHLSASIVNKLSKVLVTPSSAPSSTELVAVDSNGNQTMVEIGDNLTLENGKLNATGGGGGLNIADLPKFTNKLYINMANVTSLAGVLTLPIVSSSNFVVDWGDGTTTDYVEATTEISHTYSDTSFAGWVYIYGDWNGVHFSADANNNKNTLEQVKYDVNINNVTSEAFYGCKNLKYFYSNSVVEFGGNAFTNCSSLIHVDLYEGVSGLSYGMFWGAVNLVDLKIPNTVTTILHNAFTNCDSLTQITIPKNVTSMLYAFFSCDNLKTMVMKPLAAPSINANSLSSKTENVFVPSVSLMVYKTATNWATYANKIYPEGGNYSETITIPSTAWDTATNTVTVEAVGATSEDRNIITWNVSSDGVQVENTYGLKCTAQGTMSLTFSCETIPTEDVEVSVRYMLTNY